jgi:hypothetical protein
MSQDERLRRMAETPGGKAVMAALIRLGDWSRTEADRRTGRDEAKFGTAPPLCLLQDRCDREAPRSEEFGRGSTPVEWRVKPGWLTTVDRSAISLQTAWTTPKET